MDTVLELSLDVDEIPVKLTRKDGKNIAGKLIQLDGNDRDDYLDILAKATKMANGVVTGVPMQKGIRARLVHLSFRNENGIRVGIPEIQTWPGVAVEKLYKAACGLNGLEAEAESNAKNDSGASDTDGTASPST